MRGNFKTVEKAFTMSEVVTLAKRALQRAHGDTNRAGRYARGMQDRYESDKWAQVVEYIANNRTMS